MVARFDQHVKPLDPDIIVLQVGINDLKTIPLFPGKKELIVRHCEDNIRQIVTSSLDLGAVIVLATIFPLGELPLERRLVWSDDVSKAIEEVNQYIVSLKGMDVIVFDSASVLGNKQGIVRQEYSRDFLHLNDTGYRALNEGLVNILKEIR